MPSFSAMKMSAAMLDSTREVSFLNGRRKSTRSYGQTNSAGSRCRRATSRSRVTRRTLPPSSNPNMHTDPSWKYYMPPEPADQLWVLSRDGCDERDGLVLHAAAHGRCLRLRVHALRIHGPAGGDLVAREQMGLRDARSTRAPLQRWWHAAASRAPDTRPSSTALTFPMPTYWVPALRRRAASRALRSGTHTALLRRTLMAAEERASVPT